jgi:hypothetical protein
MASSSSTRGSQLGAALSEEGSAANANLYVLLRACDRCVWGCLWVCLGGGVSRVVMGGGGVAKMLWPLDCVWLWVCMFRCCCGSVGLQLLVVCAMVVGGAGVWQSAGCSIE